jgi:hypothetical protein
MPWAHYMVCVSGESPSSYVVSHRHLVPMWNFNFNFNFQLVLVSDKLERGNLPTYSDISRVSLTYQLISDLS